MLGIVLLGLGIELVLPSLVSKEQGDKNCYLSISFHKQTRSLKRLKVVMTYDDASRKRAGFP